MREILINNEESVSYKLSENMSAGVLQKFITCHLSDTGISVELCPNRELNSNLLSNLNVKFCSVTWHSPSKEELKSENRIPAISLAKHLYSQGQTVLLHLAGRNLNEDEALRILNCVRDIGLRNIFALQGDPSQIIEKDDNKCVFPYAVDLVRFIRKHFGNFFCIGVAGYPEKHPNSPNIQFDIARLKEKVEAGADFILTQACFDYEAFKLFSSTCRENSINLPIIPGIFIITSYKSLVAMAKFCAVPVPDRILKMCELNQDNVEVIQEYGLNLAKSIIVELLKNDLFKGVHIFSLNNLNIVKEISQNLDFSENIGVKSNS